MKVLLNLLVIFCSYCFNGNTIIQEATNKPPAVQYAVRNVTIIPMDRDRSIKNQTVLIGNGKILQIGSTDKIKVPKSALVINGTGKYLVPGLTDMHIHFFYEQGVSKEHLAVETQIMLANGITTARVMNGDPVYLDLRKQVAGGLVAGPELFVVSPQFVGQWPFRGEFFGAIVPTPEKAKEAVRQYHDEGYDAIKITFYIKPAVYDAIMEMAKTLKMKVTGHVGYAVKLRKALKAGQQIEHLDEFLEILLPDSSFNRGISVSGTNIWNLKAWETVDALDSSRIPILVRMVKESGIYVTPTNYFLHTSFGIGQTEEEIRRSVDFPYIPASVLEERFEVRNIYWENPPPENSRKKFIQLRQQITKALYNAGVPLMAGSDAPAWFLVQGFSLHYELEAFVKAGLSNYAALQTATVNPAKYLGTLNRKGTIAVGKEADFILLEKNPLEDITNTRRVNAVFTGNRFYSAEMLMKFLAK